MSMGRKLFQFSASKHVDFEENMGFLMDFLNHNKEIMLRICHLDERLMADRFLDRHKSASRPLQFFSAALKSSMHSGILMCLFL